jgi:hypothetical protein
MKCLKSVIYISDRPILTRRNFPPIPLIRVDSKFHRGIPDIISPDQKCSKPLLKAISLSSINLGHLTQLQSRRVQEIVNLPEFTKASSLRTQARLLNEHLNADSNESLFTLDELALILGLKHGASFRIQITTEPNHVHKDGRPTLIHLEANEYLKNFSLNGK